MKQVKLSKDTSVGFTGTRFGCSPKQRRSLSRVLSELHTKFGFREFHEGDCVGADTDANEIAEDLGYWIGVHPPTNESNACGRLGNFRFEPKPYLERDKDIVRVSSILVACPDSYEEVIRSGTWTTIRFSRDAFNPIIKIFPDGSTKIELADRVKEVLDRARSINC